VKEKVFILGLTCIEYFSMKALKLIFIIAIGFVFSCESNTYEEISGEIENPTYTINVKSIIDNNCLSCHSSSGGEFPTMETYLQVKNVAQNGNMICRIDDQSCGSVMPQSGRMPQTKINTIKKWTNNGCPN
jgi:hypothetical protein